MRAIHLTDPEGKDSPVVFEPKGKAREIEYRAQDGSQVASIKLIKSTMQTRYQSILEQAGGDAEQVAQMLVQGDPEISQEYCGKITSGTKTVYLSDQGKIAYAVRFNEKRFNTDGELEAEGPQTLEPANVHEAVPLIWTGRFVSYTKALRQFVFTKIYQMHHMNGLTYRFLFDMAQILHNKRSFMLLGAGEDGRAPLRFQRGGPPYRGFLRGRVDGEAYCLSLHLSNMELKPPAGFHD